MLPKAPELVNAAIRFPFKRGIWREHLGERVEFVNRFKANDSRLPARGVEDRIIVGHPRRMRHGGHGAFREFCQLCKSGPACGIFWRHP